MTAGLGPTDGGTPAFKREASFYGRPSDTDGRKPLDAYPTDQTGGPTALRAAEAVPVWLLDVDGVINASRPGWSAAPRSGRANAGGMEFKIRWAPALADRIRTLHCSGRVEIRWATTWCPWSDQIERLLALPALGRAFDGEVNGTAARLAKYAAAQQVIAEGRRLIWTDDDAIPADGPDREALAGALLIAPSSRRGLQPEDLDAIEKFLSEGDEPR